MQLFSSASLALALLLTWEPASAQLMRFSCSQLVHDRIDPLVNPGSVPSPHLHQIVGGNSFNASMDPASHDLPAQSTCTSCTFSEDFSNYWTAVLFFRARNGTFQRVPQFVSQGLRGAGGITVYYTPPSNRESVTAFKPGFRMLVGDANLHANGIEKKVCHRCMPLTGDNSNLNCAAPDTQSMPKGFCVGGIRTVLTFPTCWDGRHTDSPDHRSHVAYPVGSAPPYDTGGKCPESHPVRVPQIMYEVMWDTRGFNKKELWPEDGSQPFVWSNGDKNGYSNHGDYVFGWKGDALQRAMDTGCTGSICHALRTQPSEDAMKCTKVATVAEDIDGWLTNLPGTPMMF